MLALRAARRAQGLHDSKSYYRLVNTVGAGGLGKFRSLPADRNSRRAMKGQSKPHTRTVWSGRPRRAPQLAAPAEGYAARERVRWLSSAPGSLPQLAPRGTGQNSGRRLRSAGELKSAPCGHSRSQRSGVVDKEVDFNMFGRGGSGRAKGSILSTNSNHAIDAPANDESIEDEFCLTNSEPVKSNPCSQQQCELQDEIEMGTEEEISAVELAAITRYLGPDTTSDSDILPSQLESEGTIVSILQREDTMILSRAPSVESKAEASGLAVDNDLAAELSPVLPAKETHPTATGLCASEVMPRKSNPANITRAECEIFPLTGPKASSADEVNHESDMRIQVCVRKRPLGKKERKRGDRDIIEIPKQGVCCVMAPRTAVDNTHFVQQHQYRFDQVFDETCSNTDVYDQTARPLVRRAVIHGSKVACFAYGQTGAGKTHTMMGVPRRDLPGLYALGATDLFEQLNDRTTKQIEVQASFYEIYCGKLYDLLHMRKQLFAREDGKGHIHIRGIEKIVVRSADDVMAVIERGNRARATESTGANDTSSRSHAIIQLDLVNERTQRCAGRISFIDLAGSERASDTMDNDKQRRMEGAEINTSLLALKECIRGLDCGAEHVPFRQSKLTMVLKDSFVGDSRTCMIACLAPGLQSCEHTLNTVRYADRVKELSNISVSECSTVTTKESHSLTPNHRQKSSKLLSESHSKPRSKKRKSKPRPEWNSDIGEIASPRAEAQSGISKSVDVPMPSVQTIAKTQTNFRSSTEKQSAIHPTTATKTSPPEVAKQKLTRTKSSTKSNPGSAQPNMTSSPLPSNSRQTIDSARSQHRRNTCRATKTTATPLTRSARAHQTQPNWTFEIFESPSRARSSDIAVKAQFTSPDAESSHRGPAQRRFTSATSSVKVTDAKVLQNLENTTVRTRDGVSPQVNEYQHTSHPVPSSPPKGTPAFSPRPPPNSSRRRWQKNTSASSSPMPVLHLPETPKTPPSPVTPAIPAPSSTPTHHESGRRLTRVERAQLEAMAAFGGMNFDDTMVSSKVTPLKRVMTMKERESLNP